MDDLQGEPSAQDDDSSIADVLSPLHKLPTELFTAILINSARHGYDIRPNDPPLSLLRVCKHWRSIALDTPQLFTSVTLTRVLQVNPLVIVPLFLQRSASLPLQIALNPTRWKLNRKFPRFTDARTVMLRILSFISTHLFRCQTLSVWALTCDELAKMLPTRLIYMPILQSLKVDHVSSPSNMTGAITIMAPNLIKLCLGSHSSIWQRVIDCDPLRLCELVLDNAHDRNLQRIAALLQACINLKTFKCHGLSGDGGRQAPEVFSLLELGHLRLFSLSWHAGKALGSSVNEFLKCCRFPQLTILRLFCYNFTVRPGVTDGLRTLLTRSASASFVLPLTELRLEQLDIRSDQVVALLKELPHLNVLAMKGFQLPAVLIDTLTPHRKDSPCPKLSLLSFVGSHVPDNGTSLIPLIESRVMNRHAKEGKLVFELYDCHGIAKDNFAKLVKMARMLEPDAEILL